jgi:predicted acetyltransferase
MADVDLRPIDSSEFPAFFRSIVETFGEDPRDADREADLRVFEPERSLAGVDGESIIATGAIFSREMTVPGGPRPIAGVTMVSVAPTHRRRGILTQIMSRQLTELHEQQREPVAALWASEGGIYGRFGYGLAARRGALSARTKELRMRPGTSLGSGRVRLAGAEEARPHVVRVYEEQRGQQVGWLDRRGRWWDYRLHDPEHSREGTTALRYALNTEENGRVTGYAVYRIKPVWDTGVNETEVQIVELAATTPQAYASVWSFVTNLDLVPKMRKRIAPLDEPLQHMLLDPRALRLDVLDCMWIRLADVGRALADRVYSADVDIVLDVTDDFCPWNARRWRLSGGARGAECGPTREPAHLTLSSTDLGTAYLGGATLASLAAAGRVTELRRGALVAATRAFVTDRQPWCPEIF